MSGVADGLSLPRVMVIGASYGMLPAMRMAVAGVGVTVVGRPQEVAAIRAAGGPRIRIAARESGTMLELAEADAQGRLSLTSPDIVDPGATDLVFLAASEPQYRGEGLRDLIVRVAERGLPCVSLMNVPPLTFLRRLPGINVDALQGVHASQDLWDQFAPDNVTASSPDPQAIRPDPNHPELSEVTLPTNFKVAPFAHREHQALLESIAAAVDQSSVERGGIEYHPRVRLRAEGSLYVPLSKWPMLIAGNCCCVTGAEPISIREAVHTDLAASRDLYDWVVLVCQALGAAESDIVPFDRYATAALDLTRPSSLARALHAGARAVERPDRLVSQLAADVGRSHRGLEVIVERIDRALATATAA